MNDALQNYLSDLNLETELLMDEYNTRDLAFTAYVLRELSDLLNCGEPIIVHCCKKDHSDRISGEIYGYAISDNGEVLTLFYTLYEPSNNIINHTNTDYQSCLNKMQGFYNLSVRGAYLDLDEQDPLYEPCKVIYENNSTYQSVNLCVLSNAVINNSDSMKKIRIPTKAINSDCWDIRKIYHHLHSESDHISIDVDFMDEYKNYKIPFIEMESSDFGYKCILAMFPAKLLYKLYEKYNTNLLLNNVRYFLGFKGQKKKNANIGMLNTLREENQMFLAYNNGITALAKDIESSALGEKTDVSLTGEDASVRNDFISMGILQKILDFRIVNGGQTTATIFHSKNLRDTRDTKLKPISLYGVYVQVKLIVINTDVKKVTGNITRYSNSQSVIKYSDFSVSNEFNVTMENLSRSIIIPSEKHDIKYWFFERLRGQYDNQRREKRTKVDQTFFDGMYPKSMKFKKEEIAKVWKSWNQTPGDAVKGEATNYDLYISEIVKNGFIPDETYYKQTIALLILYKFLFSRPENKTYGNRKATIIAYAIAYLQYITFGRLNLLKIWETQSLSDNLKTYLNLLCEALLNTLDQLAEFNNKTVLSYGKQKAAFSTVCRVLTAPDRHLIDDDLI